MEACCFSLASVLTACVVTLLTIWIWQAYKKSTLFKRLGMQGPTPWPFLLNNPALFKEGLIGSLLTWAAQYPKIYGCYILGTPSVVISDLDLIRDVMVKKFGLFSNRVPNRFIDYKPWTENLVSLRDDQWKHVRSQLSPTFSSGKLKKMALAIERVVKNLDSHVRHKAETGEEVELKKMCQNFAMDAIAGVAFGLQVDSLKDPDDPFIIHGRALTNFSGPLVTLIIMFPLLSKALRLFGITFPPRNTNNFFMGVLDSSLKDRRQEDKKHVDFLQLLLEAEREGETQGPVDAEINHSDQLTTSTHWTRKGLTQDEIYGNTLVFLFAGNETLSTVMSFTLFCLAANKDCLEKARAEVDAKLGKREVDYETANSLVYLDMCMNETMRMYPPGFFLDREAQENTEFGGYQVMKGMRIAIPVISIHRDPTIWPEPMKFDPERHTPEARAERHPFAFMSFGLGPRNCIGMRLAQLEIRMAIATILQHFTPVLCEKSVYPPTLQKIKFESVDGLWVKFQARK